MKKWDRRRIKPQPKFQLRRWERWLVGTFFGASRAGRVNRGDIRRLLRRPGNDAVCEIWPLLSQERDR